MHHVSIYDLDFARVPATCYTPAGAAYVRWASVGMPKIDKALIKSTFFLFQDKDAAIRGVSPNGTGFIVYVPSEKYPDAAPYYYAISCKHVVEKSPCIRLNRVDGGTDPVPLTKGEWHSLPTEHGDIAACMINPDPRLHDVAAIPDTLMLTKEQVAKHRIGVGEDVFMIGLFLDLEREVNAKGNAPLARFGNISMMPNPAALMTTSALRAPREYILLDLHSRSGFSGSPVFFFRSASGDLTRPTGDLAWLGEEQLIKLLGIHCAQFPEQWEVQGEKKDRSKKIRKIEATPPEDMSLEREKSGSLIIKGLSGITLSAPAWDIYGLLYSDRFARERSMLDSQPGRIFGPMIEAPMWKTGEGYTLPKPADVTPSGGK